MSNKRTQPLELPAQPKLWPRIAAELRAVRDDQQDVFGPLSDEMLSRFVAGEASVSESAQIKAATATDPELREALDALAWALNEPSELPLDTPDAPHPLFIVPTQSSAELDNEPQETWQRVKAELQTCRSAQKKAWGEIDERVVARYVADACPVEERRAVEAEMLRHPDLREAVTHIGGIVNESVANGLAPEVGKTSARSSKLPWLMAATTLAALGGQTWYFRLQLESQDKQHSYTASQVVQLNTKLSHAETLIGDMTLNLHSLAAEGGRKVLAQRTQKTVPPRYEYEEPVTTGEPMTTTHIAAKSPWVTFRPPQQRSEIETTLQVAERDTRLSVRGWLVKEYQRQVAETSVKEVRETASDGKVVTRIVPVQTCRMVLENRFGLLAQLSENDLLSSPPISDLIPQFDDAKSELIRWAVSEVLKSPKWKDQHPIAEITATLLQRNDGGQAAAQYVLSREFGGVCAVVAPTDEQIEQGLSDKSTFAQWAALYALIQRNAAKDPRPDTNESDADPHYTPSSETSKDSSSPDSESKNAQSKRPTIGTKGEGIGNTYRPTFLAPTPSDQPSEFDRRVLGRISEFLASKEKSQVRLAAVYLVGDYGRAAKDSEAHLVRILVESNHPLEPRWAAYALGQMRARSPQALSQLIESLDDSNPRVPPAAACALTLILEDAPNAVLSEIARPKLRKMLQSSDPAIQHWGAYALRRL